MATVLSCVLPMLLMVPVLVVGNSNNCSRNLNQSYECLLMHTWEIYTPSGESWEAPPCLQVHIYSISIFLLTFLITCISTIVLMVKARSLYSRCVRSTSGSLDARGWAKLRLLHHQILLYASAFMVCWCPAALLAILFLFNVQKLNCCISSFTFCRLSRQPPKACSTAWCMGGRSGVSAHCRPWTSETWTPRRLSCARRSRNRTRHRLSDGLEWREEGRRSPFARTVCKRRETALWEVSVVSVAER
ncbi:hypothetical protein AGOR_G00244890 [Albula goreensis]|uniref:G-protein coupled receptors family 1 profile domain-containing protein n=1 Tax=Albula goreensis TaxID=1534307 RepID=A0A8T3CF43_9TELE|nr:hypothetical protein AGOR_G00244890 [Albula goreensis]